MYMKYVFILFMLIIGFFIVNYKELNDNNPSYEPYKFNNNKFIKSSHNCYMYSLDDIDLNVANKCKQLKNCHILKHTPGHTEYYISRKNVSTCENIRAGVMTDNPSIYLTNFDSKCKNGYYKIASSVNNNKTYHFYRQDKNNLWSHKDGGNSATNLDEDNKIIKDPKKANRGIYKTFCNYFCVPNNKLKDTHSDKKIKN